MTNLVKKIVFDPHGDRQLLCYRVGCFFLEIRLIAYPFWVTEGQMCNEIVFKYEHAVVMGRQHSR